MRKSTWPLVGCLSLFLVLPHHAASQDVTSDENSKARVSITLRAPADMPNEALEAVTISLSDKLDEEKIPADVAGVTGSTAAVDGGSGLITLEAKRPLPKQLMIRLLKTLEAHESHDQFKLVNRVAYLPADENWQTQVMYLQFLRAQDAARVLGQLVESDSVTIAVDERTNSLIARGGAGQLKIIESLVSALDGGNKSSFTEIDDADQPIELFRLKHADATQIAVVLMQLFGQDGLRVSVEPKQNMILVRASSDKFPEVRALIEHLDAQAENTHKTELQADGAEAELTDSSTDIDSRYPDMELDREHLENLSRLADQLEQESIRLVADSSGKADRAKVLAAVRRSFEARQTLHRTELETLMTRMHKLEQTISARQAVAERIIERRVEELLNPNLNWRDQSSDSSRKTQSLGSSRSAEAPSEDKPVLKRYAVQGIDLRVAHAVLATLLDGIQNVRLASDERNSSLIVMATAKEHQLIEEALEELTSDAVDASPKEKGAATFTRKFFVRENQRDLRADIVQSIQASLSSSGIGISMAADGFVLTATDNGALDWAVKLIQEQLDKHWIPTPVDVPENLAIWLRSQGFDFDFKQLAPGNTEYQRGALECTDGDFSFVLTSGKDNQQFSVRAQAIRLRPSAEPGESASSLRLTALGTVSLDLGDLHIDGNRVESVLPALIAAHEPSHVCRGDVRINTGDIQLNCEHAIILQGVAVIQNDVEIIHSMPDGSRKVDYAQGIRWDLDQGAVILEQAK